MPVADSFQFVDFAGEAVEVGSYHQLDLGVDIKCLFQRHGIHVPGIPVGVDEHRDAALVNHRVHRGVEGHVGAEDPLAFHRAVTDGGLAIEPLTG